MSEENKKKVLKAVGVVAGIAVVAAAIGFGVYAVNSNEPKEPVSDKPVIEIPDEPDPTPDPDPEPEPDPQPEPDPTPDPEPEPEPEPDPQPDPTPDPEPEPEPEQEREDMIFFTDTGELNTEYFHKALMQVMNNYLYQQDISMYERFYERAYNNYEIFAVNWNENDNKVYLFGVGELKNYTNKNNKQISVVSINDINLKDNKFENSLDKFVNECLSGKISAFQVYTLAFKYTEDDLDMLEKQYEKAYEMALHRVEQEIGSNDVVIGSYIKNQKERPASFGIGNNVAYSTSFWIMNTKTNEISEIPISICSSSALGEGQVKNLLNSGIEGSEYVVVSVNPEEDVVTIEPETLYNVDNGNVELVNSKVSKSEAYAFAVGDEILML